MKVCCIVRQAITWLNQHFESILDYDREEDFLSTVKWRNMTSTPWSDFIFLVATFFNYIWLFLWTLGVKWLWKNEIVFELFGQFLLNPFYATDLFQYSLKTSENQRFSDVFRGYRKRPVAWNGLIEEPNFWFSLIELLKMIRVRSSQNLLVMVILQREVLKQLVFRNFVSKLATLRNFILRLVVTCKRIPAQKNFYNEKLDTSKATVRATHFWKFPKKTLEVESFK